jgi:hypothetical protein
MAHPRAYPIPLVIVEAATCACRIAGGSVHLRADTCVLMGTRRVVLARRLHSVSTEYPRVGPAAEDGQTSFSRRVVRRPMSTRPRTS